MACMRHQEWSMSALDSNLSTSIWPSAIIHTQVCSPSHIDVTFCNTEKNVISHKTYYSRHSIYSEIVLPIGSYCWLWWYKYTHSICLKSHCHVKLMSSKNTVTIHTLFFNRESPTRHIFSVCYNNSKWPKTKTPLKGWFYPHSLNQDMKSTSRNEKKSS